MPHLRTRAPSPCRGRFFARRALQPGVPTRRRSPAGSWHLTGSLSASATLQYVTHSSHRVKAASDAGRTPFSRFLAHPNPPREPADHLGVFIVAATGYSQ
jgi:hypothetical protein